MISRFGVITDIHHTDRSDTDKILHSLALVRTRQFVAAMNALKADFIVELGDLMDTLAEKTDALRHLKDIENIIRSFDGPTYHVVGNHDFDSIARGVFLSRIVNTGVARGASYYSFDHKGVHGVVLDAGYTVSAPHRPFDRQLADDPFYTWQDAWIPAEELEWLASDLAATRLPTVIFTHQLLHRDPCEEHTIKNADAVRCIFERSGKIVAVFSGHDHHGDFARRNGIHYFVLKSASARDRAEQWRLTPVEPGASEKTHFTFVEIEEKTAGSQSDGTSYALTITQKGERNTFECRLRGVTT